MNENASPNQEPANEPDVWKPSTPEDFLASPLHELRTPMNVIRGYVDILSDEKEREKIPLA